MASTGAVAETAGRLLPSFRMGTKPVYLPSHVITFVQRDRLPMNEAQFKVPLTFTKLDIRDYLWNLYGVEVTQVRSRVQSRSFSRQPGTNRTTKPKPNKFMTVTLSEPFRWPNMPADEEAFSKQLWDQREKSHEKQRDEEFYKQRGEIPLKCQQKPSEVRVALAKQARELLEGKTRWNNGHKLDRKWDEFVEEQAAKRDTDLAAGGSKTI